MGQQSIRMKKSFPVLGSNEGSQHSLAAWEHRHAVCHSCSVVIQSGPLILSPSSLSFIPPDLIMTTQYLKQLCGQNQGRELYLMLSVSLL